jgi:hypothetical protein
MTKRECDYEVGVIRAAKDGSWTDELRTHLKSCQNCRDAVLIGSSLAGLAVSTAVPTSLPTAQVLWLKARIARRQRRAAILEICICSGVGIAGMLVAVLIARGVFSGSFPEMLMDRLAGSDWIGLIRLTLPMIATCALLLVLNLPASRQTRSREVE